MQYTLPQEFTGYPGILCTNFHRGITVDWLSAPNQRATQANKFYRFVAEKTAGACAGTMQDVDRLEMRNSWNKAKLKAKQNR